MATEKQKKAVNNLVENHGNVSKAMRDAGYDDTTAKNPKNLTESKGFKELCEQYGLTDELILTALVADIASKEGNRKPELELASKIRGYLSDKVDITSGGEQIKFVIHEGGTNTPVDSASESDETDTGQE